MADWNPHSYARFAGLRLRPALDLLARVGALPEGAVVDLGCGSGAVGPVLRERFSGRRIVGLDASPAMLAEARGTGAYDVLVEADAGTWEPGAAVALVFSNAALHWVPGHDVLLPRLVGLLAPGGVLAVQMPRQFGAPSHRLLRDISGEMYPDRFDWSGWQAPVATPGVYLRMLAPLGEVAVWETEYLQRLGASDEGHPVRLFTQSTAFRPVAERLQADEVPAFLARYEAALEEAYPREADGGVLFPFRRLFLTVQVP